MSPTDLSKRIFVVIVAIVLALGFAEIFLRFLGVGYGSNPLEASNVLHHVHPKNYKFFVHDPRGEYGNFYVVFDNDRYRVSDISKSNRPVKSGRQIYFLGDSFTEASQVDWKESFVGRIEALPSVGYVRNMGVSSYSPIFYLVMFRNELANLRNVDVVLQLYENDYAGDLSMYEKLGGVEIGGINKIDGGPSSTAIKILRYSYLARLVRKVQLQIAYVLTYKPHGLQEDLSFYHGINKRLTHDLIKDIKKECDSRGVKLHLMMIPDKPLSMKNQCCDSDFVHSGVKQFAIEENIGFIDLASYFSKTIYQDKLFFKTDIHLTNLGHEIVFLAVKDYFSLAD